MDFSLIYCHLHHPSDTPDLGENGYSGINEDNELESLNDDYLDDDFDGNFDDEF